MARQHGDHVGDDEGGRRPADEQSGDESHAGHAAQHRRRLPCPGHQRLGRERPAGLRGGALKSRTVTEDLQDARTPQPVPARPPYTCLPLPGSGVATCNSAGDHPPPAAFPFVSPQRSPWEGSARARPARRG